MAKTTTTLQPKNAVGTILAYDSQAPVNSDTVATGQQLLFNVLANNKSSSTLYLMFFDAQSVPANSTVPIFMPIALAQNTPLDMSINDVPGNNKMFGWPFQSGIVFAVSTTSDTLTVDSSSSVWVNVRYAPPP